jgi:hypothetical protein
MTEINATCAVVLLCAEHGVAIDGTGGCAQCRGVPRAVVHPPREERPSLCVCGHYWNDHGWNTVGFEAVRHCVPECGCRQYVELDEEVARLREAVVQERERWHRAMDRAERAEYALQHQTILTDGWKLRFELADAENVRLRQLAEQRLRGGSGG